ncbi:hypothetical protein SAMN05428988_1295 [Chitinophaga sp. YR573]|uniref:hypothetical protein n=1 Tax=Chitinophaga sp. YR573 TaxID=1881040 RepID=UPI0008AAFB4C|nr:hypothetical protein [Chitinophaga sp. YR573]SEW01744.1 hypothetical protein SAMN05428988_1295 [Chitinophaga sp. YR573]
MNEKIFKLTIIDEQGKTWNDDFATKIQTETEALRFARSMFPDCVVVPARFINKKGWFWFGVAVGFAIAFCLLAVIVLIYLPVFLN